MQPSSTHDQLTRVVDELLMLVQETVDFQDDAELRAVLAEAARILLKHRRQLQCAARRHVVGMVGLTNVGKSTLLDALLGSELAPRRNGPCTSAPIEFTYGSAYRVTAYYDRQLRRPSWACKEAETVHARLTALADKEGTESNRSIRKVVVEAPHPLLAGGLIIADTPGFGAAQPAATPGSHAEALRNYLEEEVARVFWVVLAEQGIGRREKSFHDRFFVELCDDVVVTGCEDWSTQDRVRFRHRFASCFERRLPTFHFVSGLEGLRARAANDEPGLDAAGITLLERRIRELAEPAGRSLAVERALCQLAEDIGYWAGDGERRWRPRSRSVWRPDSWDRWIALDAPLVRPLTERLLKGT